MADRILVDIDCELANRYKYNICLDKDRPHLFYFWTDNCYSCYIRKLRFCYAVCGNLPEFFFPVETDVNKSIYFRHSDLEIVKQQWRFFVRTCVDRLYNNVNQVEFDFRKKQIYSVKK